MLTINNLQKAYRQKYKVIIVFILTILVTACQPKGRQNQAFGNDFLVKIPAEVDAESYGYANQNGVEIVPIGKYQYCFQDTITTFGAVITKDNVFMAIDKNGAELYEIYKYDNGLDYVVDNRFRIVENGKIGYANELGEIVIKPQFECAEPFENGKARVTNDCKLIKDGEHTTVESESWFFINTDGEKM
jgi:hypothetical protein